VSLNKKIVIKVKHSFELSISIGYGYNANFRFFIMSIATIYHKLNSLPTVFILRDYLPLTDAGKSKGVLSVEEDEISEHDDAHDETEMGENASLEIHMVDPQEEAHISRLGEVGGMSTSLVIPVSEHSGILKSENIWACG
jgi:hypothetical protein